MSDNRAASRGYDRATCSVCEREMRVLKDGMIGPHTTGIAAPAGRMMRRRSPRCNGWGQKPKES